MDPQQQRSHTQNQPSAHSTAEPQPIPTNASENQPTSSSTASLQVTATTSSSAAPFVPSFDRSTTASHDNDSRSGGANFQAITEEVTQLQGQFLTVLTHARKLFVQKTPLGFKFMLTSLPLYNRCKQFLKEDHDRIMKAIDANEICSILEPYWNYIDYAFLKHLVKKFGTKELQKEMESYIAELEQFEKNTSIQDYDLAVRDKRNHPAHFRTVTITQAKDPAEYSLYEVRQLKNEVVKRSTLHEYTVYLQAVRCNSVEIVLAYPPEAHTELLTVFDEQFMGTHNIAFSCSATPTKQKPEGGKGFQRSRVNSESGKFVPGSSGTPPQHLPARKATSVTPTHSLNKSAHVSAEEGSKSEERGKLSVGGSSEDGQRTQRVSGIPGTPPKHSPANKETPLSPTQQSTNGRRVSAEKGRDSLFLGDSGDEEVGACHVKRGLTIKVFSCGATPMKQKPEDEKSSQQSRVNSERGNSMPRSPGTLPQSPHGSKTTSKSHTHSSTKPAYGSSVSAKKGSKSKKRVIHSLGHSGEEAAVRRVVPLRSKSCPTSTDQQPHPPPTPADLLHSSDIEVNNEDVATIARDYLTDWESLRPYLGLNRQQEEEIRRSFPNNYGKQKQECLERWRELKGDEVTYGALITAAEKARNQHLADRVKDMLSRRLVQNHNPQSTTKQEKVNEVTDQGKCTSSTEESCQPTLPELLRLHVHSGVISKYYDFGILILNDKTADEVDKICKEHQCEKDRVWKILKAWIRGKGLCVTWMTLIETLRGCKLMDLANKVADEMIAGPKPNRPTEQQLDDDVAQDIHGLDNSTKLLRLAVQLGVAYSRAVEILERSEDWYRQLMDVFSEWRKTASDYTWEALIMALRRVDEGPLADELYNKYILH